MPADAECIREATGFYGSIAVGFAISTRALLFCVYLLPESGSQTGRSTIKEPVSVAATHCSCLHRIGLYSRN
jgi:hypothetical protein